MSIIFPELSKKSCRLFRACGHVIGSQETAHRALRHVTNDKWLRATTRIDGKQHLVISRFGLGDKEEKAAHVHIDVASPKLFGQRVPPPGTPIALTKIRQVFSELDGADLFVDFEAHFWLPADQIPSLINATMFKMQSGPISVKTKAVALEIEGAPFYGVSWVLIDDRVVVEIESRTELKVSASYLVENFNNLTSVFDNFVCGRNGHVKDSD